MKARLRLVVAFCAAFVFQVGADGVDDFVNKQGNDANDGAIRETSILAIQRGVDALKQGEDSERGLRKGVRNRMTSQTTRNPSGDCLV